MYNSLGIFLSGSSLYRHILFSKTKDIKIIAVKDNCYNLLNCFKACQTAKEEEKRKELFQDRVSIFSYKIQAPVI